MNPPFSQLQACKPTQAAQLLCSLPAQSRLSCSAAFCQELDCQKCSFVTRCLLLDSLLPYVL